MEATSPYFSIPEFISKQVHDLDSSNTRLTRSVDFNNNHEEKTIEEPDWQKELKPFTDCDLNLPAWRNGFDIDTTESAGKKKIRYKAREKKIAIRELELELDSKGESVLHLYIIYLKSNPWYSLGRKLTFTPGQGYTILIEQDTPLEAAETIRLEGRFQ